MTDGLTGSVSVLSKVVYSATDLAAFVAVRGSGASPEESHNYGHGRFENIASVFGAVNNISNGAELELLGSVSG